jgi:hypothetical protein
MKLDLGERDRPVIVFTVTGRRESYLLETLQSWSHVRGIEDATLIFMVEPLDEPGMLVNVHCDAAAVGAKLVLVSENARLLGVAGNPWHAMQTGFRLADFVILAEEDTPVSTDVLEYFAWARERFGNKDAVKAICAHQIGEPLGDESEVMLSKHFSPVVWGTWHDTWAVWFRDRWGGPQGWDAQVNSTLRKIGGRVVIPARSRSQHIGEYGGAHCTPAYFPHTVSRSWQAEYGPQSYRELARVQQEEGK